MEQMDREQSSQVREQMRDRFAVHISEIENSGQSGGASPGPSDEGASERANRTSSGASDVDTEPGDQW